MIWTQIDAYGWKTNGWKIGYFATPGVEKPFCLTREHDGKFRFFESLEKAKDGAK